MGCRAAAAQSGCRPAATCCSVGRPCSNRQAYACPYPGRCDQLHVQRSQALRAMPLLPADRTRLASRRTCRSGRCWRKQPGGRAQDRPNPRTATRGRARTAGVILQGFRATRDRASQPAGRKRLAQDPGGTTLAGRAVAYQRPSTCAVADDHLTLPGTGAAASAAWADRHRAG